MQPMQPNEKHETAEPAGGRETSTSTSKPRAVVGLDLATRTGWAVCDRGGIFASGFWDLKPERGQSPGTRYLKLRQYLVGTLDLMGCPVLVAYEQTVMHAGQQAAELALGCVAVVQEVCAVRQLEHVTVFPSTLKKWATGSGRADKAAMRKAAQPWARTAALDHNEADAIHVARWGFEKYCR